MRVTDKQSKGIIKLLDILAVFVHQNEEVNEMPVSEFLDISKSKDCSGDFYCKDGDSFLCAFLFDSLPDKAFELHLDKGV